MTVDTKDLFFGNTSQTRFGMVFGMVMMLINNSVYYEGEYFKQLKGVAMGRQHQHLSLLIWCYGTERLM